MTLYIAIDGPGGSGKTYFSGLLGKKLGAPTLHLDEYGNDFEPFIGIPALVEAIRKQDADIVIFEGVGVFSPEFDEFTPYRILISTPEEVRAERVSGRDVPRSDRTAEDWEKIFSIWMVAEQDYFTQEIISKADIVLTDNDSAAVNLVLSKLS